MSRRSKRTGIAGLFEQEVAEGAESVSTMDCTVNKKASVYIGVIRGKFDVVEFDGHYAAERVAPMPIVCASNDSTSATVRPVAPS